MNSYLLLAVSMAVALLGGCGTKLFITRYGGTPRSRYLYNAVSSGVAVLILLLWNGSFHISPFTLCLGIAFGVLTVLQQIFCMKAMEIGPWSYTSVITSLSTIIPTLSGMVIWNETVAPVQVVGILLMLICICLSTDLRKDHGNTSLKWMLYCGITFLVTGGIGVMQKWHQSTPYREELGEFLIVALLLSCGYLTACTVIESRRKTADVPHEKKTSLAAWLPLSLMAVSGISVAVNNRLNLFLSGVLPSSIMFPVVNGGGLVLTTLSAALLFRERLSLKQWIGMVVGLTAVILLCNPF